MGIYTGSNSDINEAQKAAEQSVPLFPDFNTMDKRLHGLVDKVFESKFFDKNSWNSWGFDNFREFDWEFMKKGKSIVGTKAYPIPSLAQYEKCKEGNGIGVWDQNGWWRCAFPKAQVTNPRELSREDIENDSTNKFGVFFTDLNSMLDWKLHVKKLVQQKEESDRVKRETETIESIYDDYAKDVDWYSNEGAISTSKSVYYKTLPNGDAEEVTEIYNKYNDGRTENKKFKKIIPGDGSSPIIEQLGDDKKDSKLLKWIWDEKK